MTLSRNSDLSVAVPFAETVPPQQPSPEELRAALEAELQAATREYEDELLAMFDRLPKYHSVEREGGQVRHYYWNGQDWAEFDVNDPPLWVVENIDVDSLPPPGVRESWSH